MLYIVPTPLGNLQDITLRSLEVLKTVDVILAEDTRTSGKLLKHYHISKPISPYHQHNEHKIVQHIADQLLTGKTFALITDAGTPGISDPAYLLVRECAKNNIRVETLPGATAFVPALVNSGIPISRFTFEGFLPLKKGRQTLMKQLANEERTMVFYESPMRLVKTLQDFSSWFGNERQCSVSRELTKMYEETKRGSLMEVCNYFKQKNVKGEIVIVVEGLNSNKKNHNNEEKDDV